METEQKNDQLDLDNLNENEEDEEELIRTKGDYSQQLLKACQKGEFDAAKKCIDKKGNINIQDKKKWTPLVWASCKGHVQIVRLLLQNGAAQSYLEADQDPNNQPKVTMGTINQQIKPTPLQWACFKSNLQIVWLLLKVGMNWENIDPFGNNCVHLAAAGGSTEVFEALLMWGVTVNQKNTRGHEPLDLSTNREISLLIKQHQFNKQCEFCKMNFQGIKHWCRLCRNFFCKNDFELEWVWEHKDSNEKEKLEGRCKQCKGIITKHTNELLELTENYDYQTLTQNLELIESNNIEIDVKVMNKATLWQEKLRTQIQIESHVKALSKVQNYKTILKSVNVLNELVDDAKNRNIEFDQSFLEFIEAERERLLAERNLRFQLDNLSVNKAKIEEVKTLEELTTLATEKKVENSYLEEAEVLREKMQNNINAWTIYDQLDKYPLREYPEVAFIIDPKSKKPIDPWTKKPIDPKKLPPPPKKKKKKEPKFVIPDWATELKTLEQKIKELEELQKRKEELYLDDQFLDQCNDQINRMKKEIKFRKQLEEEAKMIAEYKAAMKKKK